jgi:hypothetical protein
MARDFGSPNVGLAPAEQRLRKMLLPTFGGSGRVWSLKDLVGLLEQKNAEAAA